MWRKIFKLIIVDLLYYLNQEKLRVNALKFL